MGIKIGGRVEIPNAILDVAHQVVWETFNAWPMGRIAGWDMPLRALVAISCVAGPGDYLEIGLLHGASAIMVARARKQLGIPGMVVGVDPLEGYYPQGITTERGDYITEDADPLTKVPVTPEVFWGNVDAFGLRDRIELIQAYSDPWPPELEGRRFVCAYIDGDHYHEGPSKDWRNVAPRIEPGGFVVMDDCNENCPGVLAAADEALATPGWARVGLVGNQAFIIQRVGPEWGEVFAMVGQETEP